MSQFAKEEIMATRGRKHPPIEDLLAQRQLIRQERYFRIMASLPDPDSLPKIVYIPRHEWRPNLESKVKPKVTSGGLAKPALKVEQQKKKSSSGNLMSTFLILLSTTLLVYQLVSLTSQYMEYNVFTVVDYSPPTKVSMPRVGLCYQYNVLLNLSKVMKKYPQLVDDNGNLKKVETPEVMTATDIFEMTPPADDIIDSCLHRKHGGFHIVKGDQSYCTRFYNVTKLIRLNHICYDISSSEYLLYEFARITQSIGSPGLFLQLKLNDHYFENVTKFFVVINTYDSLPRGVDIFPSYVTREGQRFLVVTPWNMTLVDITSLNSNETEFKEEKLKSKEGKATSDKGEGKKAAERGEESQDAGKSDSLSSAASNTTFPTTVSMDETVSNMTIITNGSNIEVDEDDLHDSPGFWTTNNMTTSIAYYNKYTFSFSIYVNWLLPPPYTTLCLDYTIDHSTKYRSPEECIDRCVIELFKNTSIKIPYTILVAEEDTKDGGWIEGSRRFNNMNYLSDPEIPAIMKSFGRICTPKCRRKACIEKFYTTKLATQEASKDYVIKILPYDSIPFYTHYFAVLDFSQFAVQFLSCFGIWLTIDFTKLIDFYAMVHAYFNQRFAR